MKLLVAMIVGMASEPPLQIRPQNLDRLEVQIANTGQEPSAPQTLTYRLSEDGKKVVESQLGVPTLAPGASRNLVLGGKDRLLRSPGSEAFLFLTLKDRVTAKVQKSAQFLVPGGREPVAFAVPPGEIKTTQSGDILEIKAEGFLATFRLSTGTWTQFLRGGRAVFTHPPRISANGIGSLTNTFAPPVLAFVSMRVLETQRGDAAQVQTVHSLGTPAVNVTTTYTFLADSTVVVDTRFDPIANLGSFARAGHSFEFHPRDSVVSFFGDGPGASTFDQRLPIDLYAKPADDAPHREVRWARWNLVSGPMVVMGAPTFALSGARAPSGGRVVGLDGVHQGAGGPIPVARMTSPQEYRFTLRFGGVNPRQVAPVTRAPKVSNEDGLLYATPRDGSRRLMMRVDGGQLVPFVEPVKPGTAREIEVFAVTDGWVTGPGERISLRAE